MNRKLRKRYGIPRKVAKEADKSEDPARHLAQWELPNEGEVYQKAREMTWRMRFQKGG